MRTVAWSESARGAGRAGWPVATAAGVRHARHGRLRRGQQRVAAERERFATIVATELRKARPGPIAVTEWHRLRAVARDVQDGVLRTRFEVSRVPDRFYKWYRTIDERDFADTAEGHRRRLADLGQ